MQPPGLGSQPQHLASQPQDLPRQARLLDGESFKRALRGRQRRDGERFAVVGLVNGRGLARLGVTVGRKVASRAVDRNYLKRLAREAFRRERLNLPHLDLVVRPKRPLRRDEGALALAELQGLLRGFRP